jgi:uncharacterized protein (DUF1919 family)
MITWENISEVLDNISEKQVKDCFNDTKDYAFLQVFITNTGYTVSLESCDYSEEQELDANNNGNVFVDKETFLLIFKNSKSVNPFLIELL